MKGLKTWDRPQGRIPTQTPLPTADMYICSDQENLYVGLFSMDFIEERLYEGDRLPESERSRWTVQIQGMPAPILVRFGGNKQPARASSADVEVTELPGLKHSVMLRIPRRLLSSRWGKGKTIDLTAELISHSDSAQTLWKQRRTF